MRLGSLFSGYAGLDMAVREVFDASSAWFCEIEPAPVKVLDHHWGPWVPNLGDITQVDWSTVAQVDILAGGFPCQDISNAGRQAGIEGARSGLWKNFVDAIRVLRPRYVVIENVGALVVRGLDRVLADLAALGFDAEWTTVRASDVGAPHRRERLFLLAVDHRVATNSARDGRHQGRPAPARLLRRSDAALSGGATPADTDGEPWQQWGGTGPGEAESRRPCGEPGGRRSPSADSDSAGLEGRESAAGHDVSAGGSPADANGAASGAERDSEPPGPEGDNLDEVGDSAGCVLDWGQYEPAIRRWELILGRSAPAPTVVGARGGAKLSPGFVEFMMGLPAGHVTDVPGLSINEQLKMLGNGVVPQQAETAIRILLARMNEQGDVPNGERTAA